jgi:hypothetical protein
MKKNILIVSMLFFAAAHSTQAATRFFDVQSIDTMKLSRDVAREKIKDPSYDTDIDTQLRNIADVGATHVALGTPYDEEFIPFLKRWVKLARKNNLHIWFRGNFAGWEGWFDYGKISPAQHTAALQNFILKHPDLFEDGDIFTSCPECENGGNGDPRQTGDVNGFRNFIITENSIAQNAFKTLNKQITTGYYSMNGDVARLIMDKNTTKAIRGTMTIDHYVASQEKLAQDITDMARDSGGSIVLGEFGAPIPDIHGDLNENQQAKWIETALEKVLETGKVKVVNYWTNKDSSTGLWNDDNSPRKVVEVIKKYYKPFVLTGVVTDDQGKPQADVEVKTKFTDTKTDEKGWYEIPTLDTTSVTFLKSGFIGENISVTLTQNEQRNIVLKKISMPKSLQGLFDIIISFIKMYIRI